MMSQSRRQSLKKDLPIFRMPLLVFLGFILFVPIVLACIYFIFDMEGFQFMAFPFVAMTGFCALVIGVCLGLAARAQNNFYKHLRNFLKEYHAELWEAPLRPYIFYFPQQDIELEFIIAHKRGGKHYGVDYLEISGPCSKFNQVLHVGTETLIDKLSENLGFHDIKTGNVSFDNEFRIQSSDQQFALHLLNNNVQEKLLMFEQYPKQLKIKGNTFSLKLYTYNKSVEVVRYILDVSLLLAR